MNFIKLVELVHNYITRDEDGEIEEVNRAVDGVNAEIHEGEFVAVLRHNGSG